MGFDLVPQWMHSEFYEMFDNPILNLNVTFLLIFFHVSHTDLERVS